MAQPAPSPASEEKPLALAARVHRWRIERGLTQDQLAQRAGIARSTLSKIENGLLSPTFEILLKLATGFGVEVSALLRPDTPIRLSGRMQMEPAQPATEIAYPNNRFAALAPHLKGRAFQSAIVTFTTTRIEEFGPWNSHDTDDLLMVLSGVLVFHSEGYAPLRLTPGESLHFDGSMAHACLAEGPQECRCLYVYASRS